MWEATSEKKKEEHLIDLQLSKKQIEVLCSLTESGEESLRNFL